MFRKTAENETSSQQIENMCFNRLTTMGYSALRAALIIRQCSLQKIKAAQRRSNNNRNPYSSNPNLASQLPPIFFYHQSLCVVCADTIFNCNMDKIIRVLEIDTVYPAAVWHPMPMPTLFVEIRSRNKKKTKNARPMHLSLHSTCSTPHSIGFNARWYDIDTHMLSTRNKRWCRWSRPDAEQRFISHPLNNMNAIPYIYYSNGRRYAPSKTASQMMLRRTIHVQRTIWFTCPHWRSVKLLFFFMLMSHGIYVYIYRADCHTKTNQKNTEKKIIWKRWEKYLENRRSCSHIRMSLRARAYIHFCIELLNQSNSAWCFARKI